MKLQTLLASKHCSSHAKRIIVFWGVAQCRLVGMYQGYGRTLKKKAPGSSRTSVLTYQHSPKSQHLRHNKIWK